MEKLLFFIGILEMFIIAAWTKSVNEQKIWKSGVLTFLNISIWYFIIRIVIEDVNKWQTLVIYASGCSIGTMANVWWNKYRRKK